MSAIQKEVVKLLDVDVPKKAADRPDFLLAVVRGIGKLTDEQWNNMSAEVQNWYNEAVDLKNAKKDLLDFPDFEAEQEEAPRRRAAASDDSDKATAGTRVEIKAKDLKEGMAISLVTLRGKEDTGHVIEVVKGVLAIKHGDGEEVEYDLERVDKLYTLAAAKEEAEEGTSRRRRSAADEEPEDPVKVGATVMLVTARGKEVSGEIVELTKDLIVLKEGKEEVEYPRDRVKSVTVAKADKEEGTSRRRAAAADDKGDKDDAKTRSDNGGVSVGQRIRELVLDNMDASQDEIEKLLKKEKLEFKGNTLSINYKDTHKFLSLLKERKMLK